MSVLVKPKSKASDIVGDANTRDYLLGTAADNLLSGAVTTTTMYLANPTDFDALEGLDGDDSYIVNNVLDTVIEQIGGGTDTVYSSVDYTLSAEVENIVAVGALGLTLTGNAKDNILDGSKSSFADTLAGAGGNDFYVLGKGDKVVETPVSGIDTISTATSVDLSGIDSATISGKPYIENVILTGLKTGQSIIGNTSANILTGNNRANTLTGGAGNDSLDNGGRAAGDSLEGGTGDDTYIIRNSLSDTITEKTNEGTDTVKTSVSYSLANVANVENIVLIGASAVNATGNELNNSLVGNGANNSLEGGAGNDTLNGGAGADTLNGGLGDDVYFIDNIGDSVFEAFSEGLDTINSSISYTLLDSDIEKLVLIGTFAIDATGIDGADTVLNGNEATNVLTGMNGNDVLNGNAGNDVLNGGSGNDTLDGGVGADVLTGGDGDDVYFIDNASDTINEQANAGLDTVNSTLSFTLSANSENLNLIGTSFINGTGNDLANVLNGNAGFNLLDGGIGADTLIGGSGNDTYVVDNANDVVTELINSGTDTINSSVTFTLRANVENLTLTGTAAIDGTGIDGLNNTLTGNNANNLLTGMNGNDTLNGGAGVDTLIGGLGDDFYSIDSADDKITELTNGGTDTVNSTASFILGDNVENLNLVGFTPINGTGNALANVIVGNSYTNILDGGSGIDTLTGGGGDDTYLVDNLGDTLMESSGAGTDTVNSSVTFTLGVNLESLTLTGIDNINGTGNSLANTLTGNSRDNILDGAEGNDILNGGSGNDILIGGLGNDVLIGGAGNNTLSGGADNDTISGDIENDLITGGAGADIVTTDLGHDIITVADGIIDSSLSFMDWYKDLTFTTGVNQDKIDFSTLPSVVNVSVSATTLTESALAIALNVKGAGFDSNKSGDVSAAVVTVGTNSYLAVDSNADNTFTAANDFIIQITGYTGILDISDFM
jgi:Ca2+-binding RTX toxin-like protein